MNEFERVDDRKGRPYAFVCERINESRPGGRLLVFI